MFFVCWSSACPNTCTTDYTPVCGTNAVTYDNVCKLNVATCFDDSVKLAYDGECRGM